MTKQDLTNQTHREIVGNFGSRQAADIVGITYRMLDHWVAKVGILQPSLADGAGSGTRRKFSYHDLLKLRIIKSLRDSGITLAKIHEAFEAANRMGIDITRANVTVEKVRSRNRVQVITHDGAFEINPEHAQPLLSLAFSPLEEVTAYVDNSIIDRHKQHVKVVSEASRTAEQLSFNLGTDTTATTAAIS